MVEIEIRSWAVCFFAVAMAFFTSPGCTTLRTSREPVADQQEAGKAQADIVKATREERLGRVGQYYFLPKALIQIIGVRTFAPPAAESQPPKVNGLVITITKVLVADRRSRFYLRWTQNPFYDDNLKELSVDDRGLLQTVNFDATDQTPGILQDLAEATVNVFRIAGGGGVATRAKNPDDPDYEPELEPFTYIFDPFDRAEVTAVKARLRLNNLILDLTPEPVALQSEIGRRLARIQGTSQNVESNPSAFDPKSGGVFYHPPTTVEMRLRYSSEETYRLVERKVLTVPDLSRIANFRFGRSPLVKRATALTFVDGMPSKAVVDRPSPFRAATSAIKGVTGIVADAIPTIVNVKDNRTRAGLESEKSLLDARTGVLTSEKQLLDAQRELLNARGGGASNGVTTNVTATAPRVMSPETVRTLDAAAIRKEEADAKRAELELEAAEAAKTSRLKAEAAKATATPTPSGE